MTERQTGRERRDELGIQLAFHAYKDWQTMKEIPHISDEKKADYDAKRQSLNQADQSVLDDKILELHRPDLAAPPEPVPPQEVTSEEVQDLLEGSLKDKEE